MSILRDVDREHREQFATYATAYSEAWHQRHLHRLYGLWDEWNARWWARELFRPHILLADPATPRFLGDFATVSGWGSPGQIRLRPSLLTGTHPHVRAEARFAEGRFLFVSDVLLHEMIHQYQHEVLRNLESSYKGHGPLFAAECNRIGQALGLGPVRPAKARGKAKDMPSCAHWPHCVRPEKYYQGAWVRPAQTPDADESSNPPRPATIAVPDDPEAAAEMLACHFHDDDRWRFFDAVNAHYQRHVSLMIETRVREFRELDDTEDVPDDDGPDDYPDEAEAFIAGLDSSPRGRS